MLNREKAKTLTIFVLLAFLIAIYLPMRPQNRHQSPSVSANIYILKESTSGTDVLYVGNTITDIGERMLRNLIGFANQTQYTCKEISLGNATVVQTLTKLTTEATNLGFDRHTGTVITWINSGDYAFNVTYKFTATGNIAINAAGLHWNATDNTDNNMFAAASLGGTQAFQNGWNCTAIWSITINAN